MSVTYLMLHSKESPYYCYSFRSRYCLIPLYDLLPTMYDRGVVELAGIKHRLLTILPLSSLLSASTLLLYFAYRLKTLVLTDKTVHDPLAVLNSSLYFVTELGLFGQ